VLEIDKRIDDSSQRAKSDLGQERVAREMSHEQLRERLEKFSVGGLLLEMTGLCWIVVGLTIATASELFTS
jgi:hypothetical protein